MKRLQDALILAVAAGARRCLRGRRAGQAGAREHAEVRAGAADRSRPAPRRRIAERRAHRRVLLAARRHARQSRRDRLPRGRERLQGGDDCAHGGARGEGLRRDRRAHQAGRLDRAVPAARPLVLHALRDRPGISGLRAQGRHAGRARAGHARRQPDGGGPRLLPGGVERDRAGQQPARVHRGSRSAAGSTRLRVKNLATGELLPDRIENVDPHIAWTADSRSILYLEKDPETLLARRVLRHVLGTDPAHGHARLRAGRRQLLHERRQHQGRALRHDLRAQHGVHRVALRRRGGPRARRFVSSCRASATSSTTRTISTGAGSSAPTGRRRTSA